MPGPIAISDKSFIETLSFDESAWLDQFFGNNITPILYLETLCDLEKKTDRKRGSKEALISEIVYKTPHRNAYPNIFHTELLTINLLGHRVEMGGIPSIRAGIIKKGSDGKNDMLMNQFAEIEAQQRWHAGEFYEIERIIAKKGILDSEYHFDKWLNLSKNILNGKRLKSLEETKDFVDKMISDSEETTFFLALDMFEITAETRTAIVARYTQEGKPSLHECAPYAAYVFKVKLFLYIALYSNIPNVDASYKKDILYLLYLPFCQVFISNDSSHHRMAPIFLEKNQVYVKGDDLKKSIKELNTYYMKYETEISEQGLMQFAMFPPKISKDNEVIKLWDKFCPGWRDLKRECIVDNNSERMERIIRIKEAPAISDQTVRIEDVNSILLRRKVRVTHGRWNIFPSKAFNATK